MEHENPTTIGGGKDADLFALALEPDAEETPEQPEVLRVLRQSRLFNIPVYDGSLQDWPYVATLELTTCHRAEQDHELKEAANIRLKAQAARKAIGNEDQSLV